VAYGHGIHPQPLSAGAVVNIQQIEIFEDKGML